ncbi:methyltransferase domain-containing protein, partial [Escherichia coli]|nr:methyltransferase domain-containing protein [Escherichia coli]
MDLTCDQFLGGRLSVWQPCDGYRAGVDPVLLAAAVPASAGQRVLELGCGVGVASLCLGARVPDLTITGVELQPDYAELARRNAEENGVQMAVVESDLRSLPADLRSVSFDHVV